MENKSNTPKMERPKFPEIKNQHYLDSLNDLKKWCDDMEKWGNQTESEITKLIYVLSEADDLLARLEDFTKGENGKDITKLRGLIDETIYKEKK